LAIKEANIPQNLVFHKENNLSWIKKIYLCMRKSMGFLGGGTMGTNRYIIGFCIVFLGHISLEAVESVKIPLRGPVKDIAFSRDGSLVAIADGVHTLIWRIIKESSAKSLGIRLATEIDSLLPGAILSWHGKEKSLMFVNNDHELLYLACENKAFLWSGVAAFGEYDVVNALWNVGGNDLIIISCLKTAPEYVMDEWYKIDNDIHFMAEYPQKFDEIKSTCWNKSGTTFAFIEKGDLILSDRDFNTDALLAWGFFGCDAKKIKSVAWLAGHDDICAVITDKTGIEILKIKNRDALERLSNFGLCVSSVTAIAVHPVRKCIAAGFKDGTVRIWSLDDLKKPNEYLVINAHVDAVTSLAWHPKEDCIFSGSCDETVGVWDVTEEIEMIPKWCL